MFNNYKGFHLVQTYQEMRHMRKYHPSNTTVRLLKIALVAIVTLLLWNMPSEWYGIQNLTIIQQRVIAIFAFATLMWILEVVSSWATSIAIIVLMLLFCSDSGIAPMVDKEVVGNILDHKMHTEHFSIPAVAGHRCHKDGSRCPVGQSAAQTFRQQERNGITGLPADYRSVLDVRVKYGNCRYDAYVPHTGIPSAAS